jgi:hypothetical protein
LQAGPGKDGKIFGTKSLSFSSNYIKRDEICPEERAFLSRIPIPERQVVMKKILTYMVATAVVLFSLGAYVARLDLSSYLIVHAGVKPASLAAVHINHDLPAADNQKMKEIKPHQGQRELDFLTRMRGKI